jgi:hypothetical protein
MSLEDKVKIQRAAQSPLRNGRMIPLSDEVSALCAVLDEELRRLRNAMERLQTERDGE